MDFKFECIGLKYVIQDDEDCQYVEYIVVQILYLVEQVCWLDCEELCCVELVVSYVVYGVLEFFCDYQVSLFCLVDVYLEVVCQNGVELLLGINVIGVLCQGWWISGVCMDNVGVLYCWILINVVGVWVVEFSEMVIGWCILVKLVKGQIVFIECML